MSAIEWEEYKLGDLVDSSRGISYGIVQPGEFLDKGGVPILKVNNLTEGKYSLTDVYRVSEEVEKKYERTRLKGDEILVSLVGSLGHVFKVTEAQKGWNVVRAIGVLPIDKRFNRDWIYWYLKSPEIQTAFRNFATHTVQATLNLKELKEITIPIPPVDVQKQIATILSSLDDKIELNSQTAQTLEAIAQAIFKEWFVDFNFPGSPGEMQESELGDIPKGWKVGKLGDVCRNIRKSIHPKHLKCETPYIGLEHIQRKNLMIPEWGSSVDVDSQKFGFQKGDILFGKLRPYFHKVGIAPVDGICSTDILVIEPLEKVFYSFVVNHLFDEKLITHVSAIADGTRMPRVDWKSISDYRIVIPNKLIIEEFNKTVSDFYSQMVISIDENKTLTQLRDIILPKLMNGIFSP